MWSSAKIIMTYSSTFFKTELRVQILSVYAAPEVALTAMTVILNMEDYFPSSIPTADHCRKTHTP